MHSKEEARRIARAIGRKVFEEDDMEPCQELDSDDVDRMPMRYRPKYERDFFRGKMHNKRK